jgi:Divergent InlB B-repeat domain
VRLSDRDAAAASEKRLRRGFVVAFLFFLAAFVFSGSAGSRPGAEASSLADENISFAPLPHGRVTLTADGLAEPVVCEWNLGTTCGASVPAGNSMKLKAEVSDPDPFDAFPDIEQRFYRWSTPECGTEAECTLTAPQLDDPVQAFALFTPAIFVLRVSGAGVVKSQGGEITPCASPDPETPSVLARDCPYALAAGTVLTLEATPAEPVAVEWVFGCDPGDNSHSSTCVTRPENRVIGVRFGDAPPPERPFDVSVKFRVMKGGSGGGTVTGAAINCGSDCAADVGFGDRVQLTAAPVSGSRFAGWDGAPCSVAATCTVNAGPVTAVRAVFEAIPPPPPPPPPTPAPPTPAPLTPAPPPPPTPKDPGAPKTVKLTGRVLGVSSQRVGSRNRVVVRIRVNKRANARLRIARGARVLGQRLVLLRAGRTTTWVVLAKATPPGGAWLLIRLRDADGQIVTLTPRRIRIGR